MCSRRSTADSSQLAPLRIFDAHTFTSNLKCSAIYGHDSMHFHRSEFAQLRLLSEGARQLARMRAARGEPPPRILNGAGGYVPCVLRGRPWRNSLVSWCHGLLQRDGKYPDGPCQLEPVLQRFEAARKANTSVLPHMYECAAEAALPAARAAAPVRGSFQLNLKGATNVQGSAECTDDWCQPNRMWGQRTALSSTFICQAKWAKKEPAQFANKHLIFDRRRVVSPVPGGGHVEHFNLHFQGGGCKEQMEPVFAAMRRAGEQNLTFTCEGTRTNAAHERCLATGADARTLPPLAYAEGRARRWKSDDPRSWGSVALTL